MLVPKTYTVPLSFSARKFYLEVLRPELVEIDYEAVMSSKERLRSVFASQTEWPRDDMTLLENKNDLIRHQREFENREAFAYSIFTPDRQEYVGCVYINPTKVQKYDTEVFLWVTDEYIEAEEQLLSTMKTWLSDEWPFQAIGFPGRDIPWHDWELLDRDNI